MRTKPGAMTTAGGKRPYPRDPITAVAFDRLDPRAGTPGKHRARIAAEDRVRHGQVEIGRLHRATAGLAKAPGGRSVGAGDGLDQMEEGYGNGLVHVRRAWQI